MTLIEVVRRLVRDELARLGRQQEAMVTRAVVARVADTPSTQELQVVGLDDDVMPVEHLQPYGLSSAPLDGAQALVLCVGGQREHGVAVAVGDRRYRPTNRPAGEVTLYDHRGQLVRLAESGVAVVPAAGGKVRLGSDGLTSANGVVHGAAIDPLTGLTYAALGVASSTVLAAG